MPGATASSAYRNKQKNNDMKFKEFQGLESYHNYLGKISEIFTNFTAARLKV